MTRKTLSPEEKRRTIAFTATGADIAKLDRMIEKYQTPYGIISRQTVMEELLKDLLRKEESRS